MKTFRICEEETWFREYEIEAEDIDDAYRKWNENTEDIETASSDTDWEPSGLSAKLWSITNTETGLVSYFG